MSDTADDTRDVDDGQGADDDARTEPQGGNDAGQGADDDTPTIDKAKADAILADNRKLRQRVKAAETELDERRKADETESQRLERELTAETARREQAEAKARELNVQVTAAKLGVRADATDVVAGLLDWSQIDDADDADKAIESAVKAILKARPYLSDRPADLDGGKGRQAQGGGESMSDMIRRAAGRS